MKRKEKKLVDLEEFIVEKYGKIGSIKRDNFEEGYQSFKLGIMLQEVQHKHNMTQNQVESK